jgi:hypothetical protein
MSPTPMLKFLEIPLDIPASIGTIGRESGSKLQ